MLVNNAGSAIPGSILNLDANGWRFCSDINILAPALGTKHAALRMISRCQLLIRATSLGGVESLIEHRYSIEGERSPIPRDLVRISVGIEAVDDLITDLEQALD